MEAIIDVRFGDDDAGTRKPEVMDKLLGWSDKIMMEKHGKTCYVQQKNFSVCPLG